MASGLLLALCFPPLHPLILPFVALVPFAVWAHDLPAGAEGRWAACRGGVLLGAVYFSLLLYWIVVALLRVTPLGIVAFAMVIGGLAALTGAFAWLLHRALHTARAPLWLALPVGWTSLEWVMAHLPDTLAFPWLGLGTSLTAFPELVGIAEIVGARGVTFWIALVNGLVAVLVVRRRERRLRAALSGGLVTVVVLIAPMVWGVWRASSLDLRPAARVAVIQPNIAQDLRFEPALARDSTFAALDRLVPMIVPGTVELVVLPEMTVNTLMVDGVGAHPETTRLQAYSRALGAPVLFGGLGSDRAGADTTPRREAHATVYNSAFLMRPSGLAEYRYDKRHLVPVVERVPFLPARLAREERSLGVYGVGESGQLAEVGNTAFGVLICYESAYAAASRAYRMEGADVLVNITNDAWYGRASTNTWTTALWQHPAHLVMRAIENRVGVARSANTGISLFVDPVGRMHEPTRLFEEDVRVAEVLTTDILTVYTRYGDLLGNACAAASLALMVLVVFKRAGPGRMVGRPPLPRLDPSSRLF